VKDLHSVYLIICVYLSKYFKLYMMSNSLPKMFNYMRRHHDVVTWYLCHK